MLGLIVIGFAYKINNFWYGGSLCFPLGILYAQKENEWNQWIQKGYWIKNIGVLVACCICIVIFFVMGNNSFIGNPIARNLAAVFFCIWILSIVQKLKLEWKIFELQGEISYEIFLLHPMWISIVGSQVENPWIQLGCVIVLTIISSLILHIPLSKIEYRIRKAL